MDFMKRTRRRAADVVAAGRFLIVTFCAAFLVACSENQNSTETGTAALWPTGSVSVESADSFFVQQLAQRLDRQAAEARYVVDKGRDSTVHLFARDLLRSVGPDRTRLAQAATDARVSVPVVSTGGQDAAITLGVLSGAELDRAFMARQTIEQHVLIRLANGEQTHGAPQLRAFAQRIEAGAQRRLSVAEAYVNSRRPDGYAAPGT
jgi:hypothetical protein